MILDQNSSLADLVEARRLSLRTKNACKARGITTLGQLLAVDPAELVTFRNFGARCSHEVETLRRELDEASSRGEKIYYGSPWDTRGFNSPIPAIERALSVVAETLGSVLYRRLRDMLSDYEHFAAMVYGEPPGCMPPSATAPRQTITPCARRYATSSGRGPMIQSMWPRNGLSRPHMIFLSSARRNRFSSNQ